MKLLTKHSDYAIRAILLLALNKQKPMSTREISNKEKIPYEFLRKILYTLLEKKFIDSKEGAGGGFTLKIFPKKIKITDIITVFQKDINMLGCLFEKKICPGGAKCVLRKNLQRIESILIKELNKITIESLLNEMGK
ncbi:Transcriptional regulator, Rrf2 [Candidatus Omnitrophus magneticus]|uniref:Transcriptional regulator, Rrf2 n=1 Tax=Candidatus Omnitrophus magneticus TaxID=1609969 RepID=A0A0F0CPJ6_9BACT|nr:Transcriptional regulator, Rrf2 [Candidatus Omnitrophus magneticus]